MLGPIDWKRLWGRDRQVSIAELFLKLKLVFCVVFKLRFYSTPTRHPSCVL